jgi:hypothetical protein
VVRGELERTIEGVVKHIMLKSLSNLTAPPEEGGTPVKTGFASASWILSIGEPSQDVAGEKPEIDYGPQEAGQLAIHGYTLSQGAVFLTNNAPYIRRLNYGYSPQAAAGFIEAAVTRAVNDAQEKFR